MNNKIRDKLAKHYIKVIDANTQVVRNNLWLGRTV